MKRLLLLLIFLQATIALGVDINGPLVRAGLENKSSDPSTTLTGRVYWNTANKKARIWDGSAWGDFGTGGGASAAYTVSPTAVTAVGTAGMPQLGHVIDTNDFSFATSLQYAYFTLAANPNDGGPQVKNLTPNGSPTYTTTNVLGTTNAAATLNGSTQSFSAAANDAFFAPTYTSTYALGLWVAPTAWTTAASPIGTDYGSAGGRGPRIDILATGAIQYVDSSDGTVQATCSSPATGFTAGSRHHLAYLYSPSAATGYGFIDGKLACLFGLTKTATPSNSILRVGGYGSTLTNPVTGGVEGAFVIKGAAATTDDIRKLAARRFDHNLAIGPESQLWLVNAARSDNYATNQDTSGALVSKDNNRAWMDFSGFATGSYVSAKMLNTQSSLTSVPQGSYDSGYLSSTPITTIPHGLGDVPAAVVVYYETTTNRFTPLMGSNFCETDATNLYCDWTGLTVAAASRVRIQAWSTGSMSAVTAASASQSGIINTTAQVLAGAKTFNGAIDAAGGFASDTAAYATASVPGIVSTGTQIFAGSKTFNGVVNVLTAGEQPNTAGHVVKQIADKQASATTVDFTYAELTDHGYCGGSWGRHLIASIRGSCTDAGGSNIGIMDGAVAYYCSGSAVGGANLIRSNWSNAVGTAAGSTTVSVVGGALRFTTACTSLSVSGYTIFQ